MPPRDRRRPEPVSALSSDEPVLVTGASGYVGGELARHLLQQGRPVRAMARDPNDLAELHRAGAETVRGDVLEPASLEGVGSGVRVAYYLIHLMGSGDDFADKDRHGARNFARMAREAGIEQVIYLGGLGDPERSRHLRSRHETAQVLGEEGPPLTYLRAAAVLGAGSDSFRIIYYLAKRLPAMLTPSWTRNETQPIGIEAALGFLTAAADDHGAKGRTIEIGARDTTTYHELMDEVARARGGSPQTKLAVPVITPRLSSYWIGLVTPVSPSIAKPLIESLATPTVVEDPSGMEGLGLERGTIAEAIRDATEAIERRGAG